MKHIAIATPGGFTVAYQRPDGTLCAVMDCATREAAQREADSKNREHAAMLEAQRSSRVIHREHAQRRPVRWFEPDAFA